MKELFLVLIVALIAGFAISCNQPKEIKYSGNPLFETPFKADPCVVVHNDTLYLFTGSDEQV